MRRLVRTEWLVVLAVMGILAAVVAFIFAVNPVPPTELTMSTSSPTSPDYALAQTYQRYLEEEGFTLNILEGTGTAMTAERLASGEADMGIVSSGIVTDEQEEVLRTLGSLYFEPIWVFYQADQEVRYLSDLAGKRIAMGTVGSGTRLTARRLLAANGVTEDNATFVTGDFGDLLEMMLNGDVDAGFWVVSPNSQSIQTLVSDESIALLNIERTQAYRSQYPYLTTVTIGVGSVDLANNIPSEPSTLLAGSANLIVREDVHPNLVRLMSRVIAEVHSPAGIFEAAGQFPSAAFTDVPLHDEARRYLREGETFFESSFPFVLASIFDRFIIVLIPLVPLLYPLIRGLPPVYNMAIRRRIIRWYRTLHEIDVKMDDLSVDELTTELERLEEITHTLSENPPPLARMNDHYNLQLHIDLVSKRLIARRAELMGATA